MQRLDARCVLPVHRLELISREDRLVRGMLSCATCRSLIHDILFVITAVQHNLLRPLL